MIAMLEFAPVTAESWAAVAALAPLLLAFNVVACVMALALAYSTRQPLAFLKEWDGRLPFRSWMVFWPYLAYNHLVFGLWRRLTREPAYTEIVPGLLLGRRLSWSERKKIAAHEPLAVLDLTAEFGESRFMREQEFYCLLPTLDMTAPSPATIQRSLEFIRDYLGRHTVYVHCALGHGRSAAIVLAYLLAERQFDSFDAAYAFLRQKRPGVHLTRAQAAAVKRATE